MKHSTPQSGFTLAELMIGVASSMMIVGALMAGSIGLQRSLHTSERYGSCQADQRRIMDYVSRDLRRSIAIAATDASGTPRAVSGDVIAIEDRASLTLTLPAYYRSNAPSNPEFDQPLAVITSDDGAAYGTAGGPSPGVEVTYRRLFLAEERCVCLVREEAGASAVVLRKAENHQVRVIVAPDGTFATLEGTFRLASDGVRPLIFTRDQVMLRNRRIDGVP